MAMDLTHKYIPRIEQREENLFTEEYYSSSDVKIFIDDVEQTEIGYISYMLQEQLKPLYGYSSNTYDDIAVGNRIVTGSFKVPIKNPDVQSSLEDIKKAGKDGYTVEDYNSSEQDIVDNTEWINNKTPDTDDSDSNNSNSSSSSNISQEKKEQYIGKLIELGYDIDYNCTEEELKAAVKKFQKDNNLEQNGELNQNTMDVIDSIFTDDSGTKVETMILVKGQTIYTEPSFDSQEVTTLNSSMEATILEEFEGNWVKVLLEDGYTCGYIRRQVMSQG